MNILEEIAGKTRERIAHEKMEVPAAKLWHMAEVRSEMRTVSRMKNSRIQTENQFSGRGQFYQALKNGELSYICEVKKASPSKGLIAADFPYIEIAREYELAGASAISCLTEPDYFLGSNRYLEEITEEVHIPVLKKDFTIDEYMLLQAAAYGASAILLICAILTDEELKRFRKKAEELGLDALVEAHDENEVNRAVACGAKIIGVNNRNLKDFSVSTKNSLKLREKIPKDVVFVSESGIRTPQDIALLKENGVDAVLIGETLMRSRDKKKTLAMLNQGAVMGFQAGKTPKGVLAGEMKNGKD